MIRLQQNRYLWMHFAGLAFVPLLLDICLAGLASAGPALAFGGQFWIIALLSVTPALAMQWFKPFYVFSLPPVALKPAVLSNDQRRCLQIFKSWQIKALAIAVAIFSVWLLAQLYGISPQVSPLLTPRAGLVSAAITFFLVSTFTQISVSAARALLISPEALQRVPAVDEGAIAADFLIAGIRVNQLLSDGSNQANSAPSESPQAIYEQTQADAEPIAAAALVEKSEEGTSLLTVEPTEPTEEIALTVEPAAQTEEIIIPETLPPEASDDLSV